MPCFRNATVLFLLVLPLAVGYADITSDFEDGLDGWTLVLTRDAALCGVEFETFSGGLDHAEEDGCESAGFARFDDAATPSGRGGNLAAPCKFRGNWSAATSLSWCHRLLREGCGAELAEFYEATISGAGGCAVFRAPVTPSSEWVQITAPLEEGRWERAEGTVWSELLQQVDSLVLRVELVANRGAACEGSREFDIAGIDSVTLETPALEPVSFLRGDANSDQKPDISDAVFTLGCLFVAESPCPDCEDTADTNDDSVLDVSDPVFLLNWLFLAGPEIPPPGARTCGPDPTADCIPCSRYDVCP